VGRLAKKCNRSRSTQPVRPFAPRLRMSGLAGLPDTGRRAQVLSASTCSRTILATGYQKLGNRHLVREIIAPPCTGRAQAWDEWSGELGQHRAVVEVRGQRRLLEQGTDKGAPIRVHSTVARPASWLRGSLLPSGRVFRTHALGYVNVAPVPQVILHWYEHVGPVATVAAGRRHSRRVQAVRMGSPGS